MSVRLVVYGDNLIDQADQLVEEQVAPAKRAANRAADMLLSGVTRRLRHTIEFHSAPGESPGELTGELAGSWDRVGATVLGKVGNVVRSGIKSTLPYEHVFGLEYGATGPGGRVLAARPFLRPAEAAVDGALEGIVAEEMAVE